MEYPKMDREMRQLMLMYQQLEETRALGKDEPILEYHEDSFGLTTRVVGMDAVGEVRYGGRYHADELVERAGEPLRSLSADGYIELNHGDAGPSSGTITFTEEGLKKIKYRRNFESNLPRTSKRRGGLLEAFSSPYLWRANWEGRNILVKNKARLGSSYGRGYRTGRITEYLNVDGRFPPGYRVSRTRFSKDLYGELRSRDGVPREVHAHIGLTSPWPKVGCLIAVDNVVIGGDTGKKFLT